MNVDSSVVVVTGAARGIGKGIASAMVASGWRVVLVDLDEGAVTATAKALGEVGRTTLAYAADVQSLARAHEVVKDVIGRWGRVDMLVNNAGISQHTPFLDLTEAEWDLTLGVNLKGSFTWSHAVARPMVTARYGRIVCISSVNAKTGGSFPAKSKTAYAAAKAGVLGMVRGLARELAPHVTVNAVCPGAIDTEMTAGNWLGDAKQQVEAAIPLARLGTPADVAEAVAFFASRTSYVTGEVLDLNGGLYID